MRKKEWDMGLSRVLVGICFFLNPLFSFVDILPDFIGCFFLFSGLYPLLFIDARAQSARKNVRLLMLLSIARLLLTPVFFWSSTSDDGNTNLLLSFAFGVIGLMLEFALFKSLFEMYHYLSVRCDSREGLKHLDGATSSLLIFAVVKNLAGTLPDFLTLFSPHALLEYNPGTERAAASFLFAKWLCYVALFVFVGIFGIVVFLRVRRFKRATLQESGYLMRVKSAAEEAERGPNQLKMRFLLSGALVLLTLLALFSFDYYVDYVSILPSAMVFVLLSVILYRIRAFRTPKKGEFAFALFGFAVCLAAYVYRVFYSQDTFLGATFRYRPLTLAFGVLQSLFVFFAFVLAATALVQAVKTACEIDLAPAKNAAVFFSLVSAGMCAYHYILPKGSAVTDLTEAFSFFAIASGVVFVVFVWRMEHVFHKAAEWKFI